MACHASSNSLYVGANQPTGLPLSRGWRMRSFRPISVLPHRRPHATTLKRSASASTCCCAVWGLCVVMVMWEVMRQIGLAGQAYEWSHCW